MLQQIAVVSVQGCMQALLTKHDIVFMATVLDRHTQRYDNMTLSGRPEKKQKCLIKKLKIYA